MTFTAFKAAAVQAAPVLLDLAGGMEKTIALIEEAAGQGARLIAFPECWLPGYPSWLWLDSPAWALRLFPRYFENCMAADGPEARRLLQVAIDNDIHVSLGYSERAGGSLYIAQLYLDPRTRTATPRRKLKATFIERTMFGEGDGSDFVVLQNELGRVGSLCCWEHIHPLNKFALFSQHEQVHIAAWPGFSVYAGKAFALGPELNVALSQVYAAEGGCFVLASSGVLTAEHQNILCETDMHRELLPVGGGAAMIYGPDGRPLCAPLDPAAEGIVYADLDFSQIALAKAAADPVGHYARCDVFSLNFDRSSRRPVAGSDDFAERFGSGRTWTLSSEGPTSDGDQ